MKFRLWLESDIFGFEQMKADKNPGDFDDDEMPIKQFSMQRMLDRLAQKKLTGINAKMPFTDKVKWGDKPGAVMVRITPNGSAFLERKVQNLDGDEIWFVCSAYRVNMEKFSGYEDHVADELFDKITKIYEDKVDSPVREYKELDSLAKRMAGRLQAAASDYFVFDQLKKLSDSRYIISFHVSGSGQGVLVQRTDRRGPSPFVLVDLSFNPKTGMIRVILGTVDVEGEGRGWEINYPWLDSLFTPTQKPDKIIDVVATSLKYY